MHSVHSTLRRIALMMALLTLILVAGSRTSVTQAQPATPTRPPVDHAARDAYWAARHGPITPVQYQQAVRQGQRLPQASQLPPISVSGAHPSSASPLSNVWTSLGPAPINSSWGGGVSSGRLAALAIDPTTSGSTTTIYIASAGGGVWKTTNNGASWLPLTDNQASLASGAIAIDPNNHNVIYVGTGEPNQSQDSYRGSGVLKSTDGGTNWTLLGNATFGTRSSSFSRIVIDPKTGNIFAATSIGLYISADGGASWGPASGVPTNVADDVAINSTTTPNSTLYAVVRSQGLYRSQDGGGSWSPLTTGLPAGGTWNRTSIAIAPSLPSTLYLAISNSSNVVFSLGTYNGGYYSTDGGDHWNQMLSLNNDFTDGEPWYTQEFAVDPVNPNIVYGGGINLWYTPNAQAVTGNWVVLSDWANSSSLHADQHGMAFPTGCAAAPCPAYFANDGGIYYAANPATSIFTDLNTAPLAITEFTGGDLGTNFNTTKVALGGTQDNGGDLYTGNTAWNENASGDGGWSQIDYSNTQYMYTEYIYADIEQSTNGGTSFSDASSGLDISASGGALFYSPLVLDRSDGNHLATGDRKAVYETINARSSISWYKGSQTFSALVSAIGISPNNSAIIYAGLNNGTIFKTTSGHSGTMSTYTQMATPTGAGYISSITLDPNDATSNTVVVTTGQTVNTPGGIFLTTNGGTTWTPITGTLPAYPINTSVVYYSGSTRVIVVGTDYGVSFTTNDGVSWQGLNYGLPNVPVTQLAIDQQKTTLAAYTHGRGAWVVSIPTIVTGPRIDTIGIFRPSDNTFYMRLQNTTGFADITFPFNPGTHPYPVVGDWTGAGFDTVGVFDQSNGLFNLRNSNTAGGPDEQLVLGNPNDAPLAGRWQAGALTAGVGVFRPSNGLIYLKNQLTTGFADYTMVLGIPGDTGLAGDWNGDGVDSPGVYRPSAISFYLSNQVCNCAVFGDYQFAYGVGGDAPVVGDWTGLGHDGVGLFRQSNGFTYLKNALTTGFADITFVYGSPGDFPVAGHWQIAYPPVAPPENLGSVLVPSTSAPIGAAPPSSGLGD